MWVMTVLIILSFLKMAFILLKLSTYVTHTRSSYLPYRETLWTVLTDMETFV